MEEQKKSDSQYFFCWGRKREEIKSNVVNLGIKQERKKKKVGEN